MPRPDAAQRAVAVEVHDVSPATWPECRDLLALLDDVGASPVSLLVVPHYHHAVRADADRAFVRAMGARISRGDEPVLHGLFHVDDAPAPRTPQGWFERRMLTRAEGEFAVLDADAAASRIARGIALFERLRWPLAGFVPPAWLLGPGTREALARCGHPFDYVIVRTGMFHLPGWRLEHTANVWYSPDSAWRRAMSACVIRHTLSRSRDSPLLRISLHPQDARVPAVLAHWRTLIGDVVLHRTPVTNRAWCREFRAPAAMRQGEGQPAAGRDCAPARESASPVRGAS